MAKKIKVVLIGAGSRGMGYARGAKSFPIPERGEAQEKGTVMRRS